MEREAVIAAIGDGISIQDRNLKIIFQNKVHMDMVGGDKSGMYCYQSYSNSDTVCEGCPVIKTLHDGGIHMLQKKLAHGDGNRTLEIKSSPLRDRTGAIVAVIEAVRDITERKEVEKALEERDQASAKADQALSMAKKLKDEKVLKEYVEKAEDLPHLPIEPLKFGPVMKALGEAHPAEFAEVYRVLKAVDAIVEKSALFSEIGKAGQGNSAEAQIYAKAKEEIPGLEEGFARGEFAPLLGFLREKVHRHGRMYEPKDLIRRATAAMTAAPRTRPRR